MGIDNLLFATKSGFDLCSCTEMKAMVLAADALSTTRGALLSLAARAGISRALPAETCTRQAISR